MRLSEIPGQHIGCFANDFYVFDDGKIAHRIANELLKLHVLYILAHITDAFQYALQSLLSLLLSLIYQFFIAVYTFYCVWF